MFRFLFIILIKNILSQEILVDNHNCNVDAGYTWCETYNKCLNPNYEPCLPITKNCVECIALNFGDDSSCGPKCSISFIEQLEEDDFIGTDNNGCILGDTIKWCETMNSCIPYNTECPIEDSSNCQQLECPIFCENGYKQNNFGCQICKCDITNDQEYCPLRQADCGIYNYVCPILTEVTHCSTGGIPGYTTYVLSLRLLDENIHNIYALFGDKPTNRREGSNLFVPSAYQENNIFNANFGGIPEEMLLINPSLRYDSWLTIGLINGDPEHKISSVGVDFEEWNNGGNLVVENGAIFLLDPMEKSTLNEDNNYVIAQLTINNELTKQALFNVQGKMKDGSSWAERYIIFNLKKGLNNYENHQGH